MGAVEGHTSGWYVDASFPPRLSSVTDARALVRTVLVDRLGPGVVDDVELVVSELVTNAVCHAATPVGVGLAYVAGVLRGEVRDLRPEAEIHVDPGRAHTTRPTGRGLLIVDALTHDWGVEQPHGAKRVWWEIRLTS